MKRTDPDYKQNAAGVYCFRIPINGSQRHRWVPTGEYSLERAREVVKEAGADRLVMLANAQAMTHDAISVVTQGRRVTGTDVVTGWHRWMLRRVAPSTLTGYTRHVAGLIERFGVQNKPLSCISEDDLHEYVNGDDLGLGSIQNRMKALYHFYLYASAHGYIVGNPFLLVEIERRTMSVERLETRHHEPITEDEYNRIRAHWSINQFWRDAAVLGYCCGLRLVDCCLLEWASFTRDELIIHMKKHRSGGKRLALPLNDPLIARPELQELIERLTARPHWPSKQYVWADEATRYLGPSGYGLSIRFAQLIRCKRIGVNKSFHGFRSAFARRLRDDGVSIENVARALGHSSIETSKIYTGESE